jgi:heat shock protein HslJ
VNKLAKAFPVLFFEQLFQKVNLIHGMKPYSIMINLKKSTIIMLIVFAAIIAIAVLALYSQLSCPTEKPSTVANGVSEEESLNIAKQFLKNSQTYKFDGIEETLKHKETLTLRCPYCWQFIFTFDSRQAGYGDRTGKLLAQVITPHTARITVEQGEVTYAILDKEWDMLQQIQVGKDNLLGKDWILKSFIDNGESITLHPNSEITIKFDPEEVTGSGGCNRYFGSYKITNTNNISIGPLAATEMACPDIMEQETKYLAAIQKINIIQVTEKKLQLSSNDGKTVLDFDLIS